MSAFMLKIIALITMTLDHTSYLLFGRFSFLNYIGRIAFPIFAFQISEGYIHTNNLKKYALRLFIFALISQIPFLLFKSIFTTGFSLNIFFTLLLGLFSIILYDNLSKIATSNKSLRYLFNTIGLFFVFIIAMLADLLHTDYGFFGVCIIFVFYIFKNHKLLMNIAFILACTIYYSKNILYAPNVLTQNIYLTILVFTLISLIFINLYNNKKGKNLKYIFYIFYPIHLLIIYTLSFLPIFPIS